MADEPRKTPPPIPGTQSAATPAPDIAATLAVVAQGMQQMAQFQAQQAAAQQQQMGLMMQAMQAQTRQAAPPAPRVHPGLSAVNKLFDDDDPLKGAMAQIIGAMAQETDQAQARLAAVEQQLGRVGSSVHQRQFNDELTSVHTEVGLPDAFRNLLGTTLAAARVQNLQVNPRELAESMRETFESAVQERVGAELKKHPAPRVAAPPPPMFGRGGADNPNPQPDSMDDVHAAAAADVEFLFAHADDPDFDMEAFFSGAEPTEGEATH